MTTPTLEERARELHRQLSSRGCADGGDCADLMACCYCLDEQRSILAFARSAQVEALERAAGLCEFYGNTVEAAPAIRAEAERVKNGESLT